MTTSQYSNEHHCTHFMEPHAYDKPASEQFGVCHRVVRRCSRCGYVRTIGFEMTAGDWHAASDLARSPQKQR